MAVQPVPAALQVRDLAVGHRGRAVLTGVDLAIAEGERVVIVGPNGCGKSTLLRAVVGLAAPLGGTIEWHGTPLPDLRPRRRAQLLTYLPQAPLTPSGVTLAELVAYGRHPHRRLIGPAGPEDRAAVAAALARVELTELADRSVDTLSGGERQRGWLAMALAQGTSTIVLDEPTSFLDIRHQIEVLALIRSLSEDDGYTVLTVLHDLDQAAYLATRLVVVDDGRVIADGPPAEIITAELLHSVFGVHSAPAIDPLTGRVHCHIDIAPAAALAAGPS